MASHSNVLIYLFFLIIHVRFAPALALRVPLASYAFIFVSKGIFSLILKKNIIRKALPSFRYLYKPFIIALIWSGSTPYGRENA